MNLFDNLLIKAEQPLLEGIKLMDASSAQIILVINDKKQLLGTITDGDIRRALMKGMTLECSVGKVMQKNFFSLPIGTTKHNVLAIMKSKSLHQIPIIDENNVIVEILFLNELTEVQELQNYVVLMAGGQGSRLRPHTEISPKPMLLVAGKPMIEIIMEQCIEAGFNKFFISVNYLKEQIIKYFKDGNHLGVEIHYLEENIPLGTAGGLKLLPEPLEHDFLVINCDVLTSVDYSVLLHYHSESHAKATVCVRDHETLIPFGIVHSENGFLVSLEEKPVLKNHINAGVYVISPGLLDLLPIEKPYDMPQLLDLALKNNYSVATFPIHEYWIDVGNPEAYERANLEWSH
jgi:dTDP-glucose pyrophosphorylase/predicted transcriptional regulator